MAKIKLSDIRTRASTIDRAKLDAMTKADVDRFKAEDGYADVDPPAGVREVIPPRQLRVSLGLTQQEMADALRIPLGTWRNWEQERVALDPAARSLLEIVGSQPVVAFKALGSRLPGKREP